MLELECMLAHPEFPATHQNSRPVAWHVQRTHVVDRTAGWWGVVRICPPKISPSFPQDTSHCPWDIPSEGTKQHFHDNGTTRCLLSVSWDHSLGTWDVSPFTHTQTPCTLCVTLGWEQQNKMPSMACSWLIVFDRSVCVCVFVFWRGTDCIKMLKSSFIFNGSRGLPITGTAGRLWDDLIPALLWAEVVLHS